MDDFILEVCVDSVESALAAVRGGARRLEVCSSLIIGGTTPGVSEFRQIRRICDIPLNVLIRPRYGDFLYTEPEFTMIREDIQMFRELGADGFVVGCLTPAGNLDLGKMAELREAGSGLHMTLHRAFDVCRDPRKTLEDAVRLGIDTILTSGQQDSCVSGKELLRELIQQAAGRIEILVGSGVTPEIIAVLAEKIGATCFHMSGKKIVDSGMKYRNPHVNMGVPGFGEYEIFRTDEEQIACARQELERRKKNSVQSALSVNSGR